MIELHYEVADHWPALAWLAKCDVATGRVSIVHGSGVDTYKTWFAEAVWNGVFSEGRLDETDVVFGSGARIREDGSLVFVSSASVSDRLQHYHDGTTTWVSNSLVCLISQIRSSTDVCCDNYFKFFESVVRGIDDYDRELAMTGRNNIELTYWRNLHWENGALKRFDKPFVVHDVSSYKSYYSTMVSLLGQLRENMDDPIRHNSLSLLSTVSSGYDSTAITVLAREVGLGETLSFKQSRDGLHDDGAKVSRMLGLKPTSIDSNAWRKQSLAEVPFIASDAKGEDVYFTGAASVLRARVLLTGYGGSAMWGRTEGLGNRLRRTDQSGLSHTEHRLWAGYLHAPIGQLMFDQADDLRALTNSSEMQKWDIEGGYSKPICRRIVEEAGIAREQFAQKKQAASILLFDRNSFLCSESRADFDQWCQDNLAQGGATLETVRQGMLEPARFLARGVRKLAARAERLANVGVLQRVKESPRLAEFANYESRFELLFPWALERAIARYQ